MCRSLHVSGLPLFAYEQVLQSLYPKQTGIVIHKKKVNQRRYTITFFFINLLYYKWCLSFGFVEVLLSPLHQSKMPLKLWNHLKVLMLTAKRWPSDFTGAMWQKSENCWGLVIIPEIHAAFLRVVNFLSFYPCVYKEVGVHEWWNRAWNLSSLCQFMKNVSKRI